MIKKRLTALLLVLCMTLSLLPGTAWAAEGDVVTFDLNDGSDYQLTLEIVDGKLSNEPSAVWQGHSFQGWRNKESGQTYSPEDLTNTASAMTLYAIWSDGYDVKFVFNDNDNTAEQTMHTNNSGVLENIPDEILDPRPYADNFIFWGWYEDENFTGQPVDITQPFSKNVTLYAKWTETVSVKFYSVEDDTADPVLIDTKVIEINTRLAKPADPSRDGYTFDNWYTAGTGGEVFSFTTKIIDTDTEIYARWKAPYTITFDANGGTFGGTTQSMTVATDGNGKCILPTTDPTREGYDFKGWKDKDDTSVTADTKFTEPCTVYAQWEQHPYIEIIYNNGTNRQIAYLDKEGFIEETYKSLLNTPTFTGHTFQGWKLEKDGVSTTISASDVKDRKYESGSTLTADWGLGYPVTFKHTGSWADNTTGEKAAWTGTDGRLDLENNKDKYLPTLTGHTFDGWFSQAIGGTEFPLQTGPSASPDSDVPTYFYQFNGAPTTTKTIELYAHWTPYTIIYNANGGTVTPTPTQGQAAADGTYPALPIPSRDGYTFDGWYTAETGDELITAGTTPVSENNVTIYAHWTETPPATNSASADELIAPASLLAVPFAITAMSDDETTSGTPAAAASNQYVATFYMDAADAQADKAHFTLTATGSGTNQTIAQLPEIINMDGIFDGWYTASTGGQKAYENDVYTKDTPLYARWKAQYLITFDWNIEPAKITSALTDENGIVAEEDWPSEWPDAATAPGATFSGWYTAAEGGSRVNQTKVFTEPTTLYAHWAAPYVIKFDPNGGEFDVSDMLDDNNSISTNNAGTLSGTLPTAKREGYTFGGWSETKDGSGGAVDPTAKPLEGPATLYAVWTYPYDIAYDANGGTFAAEPTAEQLRTTADGTYPTLPTVSRDGYGFAGWFTEDDEAAVAGGTCTGPVTLYAKWEHEPPYKITFDANGGSLDRNSELPSKPTVIDTDSKGVLKEVPNDPVWRGHTFLGWFDKADEGNVINNLASYVFPDDMTLYAQWSSFDFTITLDFNLSSVPGLSNPLQLTNSIQTEGGRLPAIPAVASGEYSVVGWYTSSSLDEDTKVDTKTVFTRDTTIYAKWEKSSASFQYAYVIFTAAAGGKELISLEVGIDNKISFLPTAPRKDGYTFDGWYLVNDDGTEEKLTTATLITGVREAYAKYLKIVTVTFDANGGSVSPSSAQTTSGKLDSLPTPTRDGYTFDGWYTRETGGSKVDGTYEYTDDTTLYAHWTEAAGPDDPSNPDDPDDPDDPNSPSNPGNTSAPFTVTFNADGGNISQTTALTDLTGKLQSLPTPTRTGYQFDGWYDGNTRVTTATVLTKDTTLTAHWTSLTGSGSSSGSSSDSSDAYRITVESGTGGRVTSSAASALEGDRVTITVRPYSGYYLDTITVTNSRGRDVTVREQGNNQFTFYMPASRVTVDVEFVELTANGSGTDASGSNTGTNGTTGNTGNIWGTGTTGSTTPSSSPVTPSITAGNGIFSTPVLNTLPMPFTDVNESAWYYTSVDYMWKRSLMGGVSATRFGPNAETSNAMVWTILARLGGVDVTTGSSIWYENARNWAVANGISDGVGPNSPVTREQLASMLWRFKGSPAASFDLGQFSDRASISTYQAECALRWCVANGIVSGSNSRLNPRGSATRAEVAAMITRFCQNT